MNFGAEDSFRRLGLPFNLENNKFNIPNTSPLERIYYNPELLENLNTNICFPRLSIKAYNRSGSGDSGVGFDSPPISPTWACKPYNSSWSNHFPGPPGPGPTGGGGSISTILPLKTENDNNLQLLGNSLYPNDSLLQLSDPDHLMNLNLKDIYYIPLENSLDSKLKTCNPCFILESNNNNSGTNNNNLNNNDLNNDTFSKPKGINP